jgi:hypothetical protein
MSQKRPEQFEIVELLGARAPASGAATTDMDTRRTSAMDATRSTRQRPAIERQS